MLVANRPTTQRSSTTVLDVEGYVPRDTILNTGTAKVLLSKSFIYAMIIHSAEVDLGIEFVMAGGAEGALMGSLKRWGSSYPVVPLMNIECRCV